MNEILYYSLPCGVCDLIQSKTMELDMLPRDFLEDYSISLRAMLELDLGISLRTIPYLFKPCQN